MVRTINRTTHLLLAAAGFSWCPLGCGSTLRKKMAKLSVNLRHELSKEMVTFAEKMRSILGKRIFGKTVTLALDGGKIHHKMQSLTILVGLQAYYLMSAWSAYVCTYECSTVEHCSKLNKTCWERLQNTAILHFFFFVARPMGPHHARFCFSDGQLIG